MIGLIDIARGLIELLGAAFMAWQDRAPSGGRPPKLETRERPNLDRLNAWLRFRGATGQKQVKERDL